MIDTETAGTPGWWLELLLTKLHNRRTGRAGSLRWTRDAVASSRLRPPLTLLEEYHRGDPPLREDIHGGWAAPFRQFVRMGRLNVADLLVGTTSNRMGIRDFKTAAAQDELGDTVARDIMRANNYKLVAREVHDYMLALGDGYTMITPPDQTRRFPLITAESPMQCITAQDSATGETLAGLKVFHDEWTGADMAYLFLPGELWVARMEGPSLLHRRFFTFDAGAWTWAEDLFDNVPGNTVPIVRFRNKRGVGEFEPHLNHLDRINDKLFNEWWIGKIQAFRQRAVKNLPDLVDAIDPATGKVIQVEADYTGMFTTSPDALWQLPEDAEMWESGVVDVGPLVNSVQKELQWLAAVTSRPLHTITPDAANGSAEGASTMKEEHVYDVEDRRDRADGSHAKTLSLAFLYMGDPQRADITKIETLWGPIERFSLQEASNAASLMWGKLPAEAIFTDILQYAPAEIANLRTLHGRDFLWQPPAPAVPAAAPASPFAGAAAAASAPPPAAAATGSANG